MKKISLLAAGLMFLLVIGIFYGLVLFNGPKVTAAAEQEKENASSDVKFVPPLERIMKERQKNTSGVVAHTKMTPPKTKIFQTLYKEGTQVTFSHEAHVDGYGLGCIECHHVERCNRCHTINATNNIPVTTGKQALHENCIGCHSESGGPQKCDECHKQ